MRGLAVICFFLSGASGLIFQVIWTRLFSLVFGATSLALSTVLAAFMGGLALGSFFAGRLADRLRDPLKLYAFAEAGIGLCALLLPLAVSRFDGLNRLLYAHFADQYLVLASIRFVASAAVIIVPTTLMGATLPLLARFFVSTQAEHARVGLRVGTLYAINTAGAVLGTALGGFVLLPALGLTWTNRVAAGVNICLALAVALAYWIRRHRPTSVVDPEVAELLTEVAAVPAPPLQIGRRCRRAVLVAFACSGAAAMVYQVIWTRALNMAIGSSVYSFTIVLTAFLIGLAGGAALIGRLTAASKNPVGLLALNHLAIVLLVGFSYLLIDKLGHLFLSFVGRSELDAARILSSQFSVTMLAMLPATVAMGGVFPLTIRSYAASLDAVGADVGRAYSLNTIGAIVGSFLAGFVVIPLLQLEPGLYAAACVSLVIAVALAWLAPWGRRPRLLVAGAAALLALVPFAHHLYGSSRPLLPRWDLYLVSAGLFRPTVAREALASDDWSRPDLVYYHDGISTTVTVERWSKEHYSLKNNGKVDASTGDDMPTQIAVGLIPLLIHPRSPDFAPEVALIGFASGVSAGAILQYPVKRLDVVELEPAIIAGSRFFNHVNNRPLDDPRTRLSADDGRNYLAAGQRLYDVIVNEPSNPWITGVSNLFTREYFEIAKRRLRPDGVFCTWAQLYEMGPRRVKSIYRAFAAVFPHVYAFSASSLSADTFLVGSRQPLRLDLDRLTRALRIPRLKKELGRGEITTPHDLAALTLMGPGEMHAFIIGAAINTDDNALVEFAAPRDLYNHRRYDYYLARVYGQNWLYGRLDDFLAGYRTAEDYAGLVRGLLTHGRFREAHHFYSRVEPDAGPVARRVTQLMTLLDTREASEVEFPLTAEGVPLEPPHVGRVTDPALAERVAREYLVAEKRAQRGDFAGALDLVEGWPDRLRENAGLDFQLFWGYLAYKTSHFHQAVNILQPLWEDEHYEEKRPALLYYLGRSFYGNADFGKAVKVLEQWIVHRIAVGKPIAPPDPTDEEAPPPDEKPTSQPS